jgi:hypothetical protein
MILQPSGSARVMVVDGRWTFSLITSAIFMFVAVTPARFPPLAANLSRFDLTRRYNI